jgi:hypothetical protein
LVSPVVTVLLLRAQPPVELPVPVVLTVLTLEPADQTMPLILPTELSRERVIRVDLVVQAVAAEDLRRQVRMELIVQWELPAAWVELNI